MILKPIAHWRRFKIGRQASAPSVSAGLATDTRYRRLHSHTSNTHTAVRRAPFRTWQSLVTRGQIVRMASSSESFDSDDNLLLFCCWYWCGNIGEWRKRPTKGEERFGVESALKYPPRWDRPFLMCLSVTGVAPPALDLTGQYQALGVRNRISSIPRVACFWREATTFGRSCRAAQTPHTGRGSRILHRRSKTDASTPSVRWDLHSPHRYNCRRKVSQLVTQAVDWFFKICLHGPC